MVSVLACRPGAVGAPARLDPAGWKPRAETLGSAERQAIYLDLIENFVGWAESSGRFVESDRWEPGGGYFSARGHGVTWARGNSNLCLGYALLLGVSPRQHLTVHRIPRAQLEDHLRRAIRSLCLSNRNCTREVPGKRTWGGPSWQASLEIIGCAWAVYLVEKDLDADTRALVEQVTTREADLIAAKEIPSGKVGNTRAEDCTWNAALLAFAASKYRQHAHAGEWDRSCRQWALNAVSTAGDATSSRQIDGQPLGDWIVSENLYPDLTMENHGFWSVGYQCTYQHFGEGELAYRVFGRPVPEAFAWRAAEMWNQVNGVLFLWDGDLLFPTGQDWNWKVYSHVEYLCWQAACRGNAAAGAYESRALQMIHQRQLSLGTGELGADNFGNQSVKLKRWSFCYLMHEHFPSPGVLSVREAEQRVLGVHIYPWTKVAIHRTPRKCVSVSWHPRSQAIYILPEGDSTFTRPPFFLPWSITSGCPTVEVEPARDPKRTPPPVLLEARVTDGGHGMRVSYQRPWGGVVTQYVSVVSLPDEATVYSAVFRATGDATVRVRRPFALTVAAPPGWERPVRQFRGTRWVNISDHLGFVSADPLPREIPEDSFFLHEDKEWRVKKGEWFGRSALVVYARQPHDETARLEPDVELDADLSPWRVSLRFRTSRGPASVAVDFSREKP